MVTANTSVVILVALVAAIAACGLVFAWAMRSVRSTGDQQPKNGTAREGFDSVKESLLDASGVCTILSGQMSTHRPSLKDLTQKDIVAMKSDLATRKMVDFCDAAYIFKTICEPLNPSNAGVYTAMCMGGDDVLPFEARRRVAASMKSDVPGPGRFDDDVVVVEPLARVPARRAPRRASRAPQPAAAASRRRGQGRRNVTTRRGAPARSTARARNQRVLRKRPVQKRQVRPVRAARGRFAAEDGGAATQPDEETSEQDVGEDQGEEEVVEYDEMDMEEEVGEEEEDERTEQQKHIRDEIDIEIKRDVEDPSDPDLVSGLWAIKSTPIKPKVVIDVNKYDSDLAYAKSIDDRVMALDNIDIGSIVAAESPDGSIASIIELVVDTVDSARTMESRGREMVENQSRQVCHLGFDVTECDCDARTRDVRYFFKTRAGDSCDLTGARRAVVEASPTRLRCVC